MGKFKRFCMIVFVVAAVLGIGVLAALWFAWEPLFPAIAWLMSMPWFFVVESHHGLSTDNVKVHITNKHDPRMSIHAKIDPGRNAELGQLGAKLQDEIAATLEAFTGYPVDSVRITFAGDADVVTPAFTQQATKYTDDTRRQHQTKPVPAHVVE